MVQSAGFFFCLFVFILFMTSSSDFNGPVTLAAVHVYQLRRTRRRYNVIVSRSDLMFISKRHRLMGVTLDFHLQKCRLVESFDHLASIFIVGK